MSVALASVPPLCVTRRAARHDSAWADHIMTETAAEWSDNGHFPELCKALEAARPGRKGAATLCDGFRNGFAHLRGPKPEFAIAEDRELGGDWADRIEIDGVGQFVAINVAGWRGSS